MMGIISAAWPSILCRVLPSSRSVSRHLSAPHVFSLLMLGDLFIHLFLLIYSLSQSRTCWYFLKLLVSHCMLTPSHFPALLHSLTHRHRHTRAHTHRLLLFEQLCSALCMFISAIVMVLLSFLPLCCSVMSLWETIREFNMFAAV